MKNLNYTCYNWILLLCFSLLISSCKDYLEMPPKGSLATETFYKTPSQAEQGVVGIYAVLRRLSNDEFLFLSECRSDNVWVNPTPNGFREYSEIGTFRAGEDIGSFNSVWNTWYRVIYNANVAIEKVPTINFDKNTALRDQLLGEAYFLRGWAYFEMVRLFGNIPIIDKVMSPAEVLNVPQSTMQEVYDKMVIPDLTRAKTLLPESVNMKNANGLSVTASGRVDLIAARAMLGRVYMTMSGFPLNNASAKPLAETELLYVINYAKQHGDKFWANDIKEWRSQWMAEYNNKYSIFAIQHRSGGTGNPSIYNFCESLPLSYTGVQLFVNQIYVEKTLMYELDKIQTGTGQKDLRGINHSILTGYDAEVNFPTYSNTKEPVTINGTTVNIFTKTMFYKYLNSKRKRAELGFTANIEASMQNFEDWPVNYPVIRLEDVMLMYAEIQVEKGNTAEAMDIVNKIRKRAGCDELNETDAGKVRTAVRAERRLELMGEGVRWFDIVRWGEWKTLTIDKFNRYNNPDGIYISNVKEGRYLYPIPLSQMNVKPGVYKQNLGY